MTSLKRGDEMPKKRYNGLIVGGIAIMLASFLLMEPAYGSGPCELIYSILNDAEIVGIGIPTRLPALAGLLLASRSEEHTSELQSLMRISYAVFCLKKKKHQTNKYTT